jgi:SAM-dependent methyltransferase
LAEKKPETVIALDYDGTASLFPRVWNEFADRVKRYHGIEVIVVTSRPQVKASEAEIRNALPAVERVYHTSGLAKSWFCSQENIKVDIWIDDSPRSIYENLTPTIKKCTCGRLLSGGFAEETINDIPTRKCCRCGTLHQTLFMTKEQLDEFYRNEYHGSFQKSPLNKRNPAGAFVGSYSERYEKDLEVARLRLEKYRPSMKSENKEVLDLGSANGAFVDHVKQAGFKAIGVDPGKDVAKNSKNMTQDFLTIGFARGRFGLVTMHDVFEHLIDPVEYLREVHRVLAKDGLVIIDLPDYWTEAGQHHWKLVQHLWFWTEKQMSEVVKFNGFNIEAVDIPIPGKKVFYLRKRLDLVY